MGYTCQFMNLFENTNNHSKTLYYYTPLLFTLCFYSIEIVNYFSITKSQFSLTEACLNFGGVNNKKQIMHEISNRTTHELNKKTIIPGKLFTDETNQNGK